MFDSVTSVRRRLEEEPKYSRPGYRWQGLTWAGVRQIASGRATLGRATLGRDMAGATQYLDSLVKEFLLYRGFTNTLRTFDTELR